MSDGSEFIEHLPCPKCGSSDANSLYSDGHTYCFSCGAYGHPDGEEVPTLRASRVSDLIHGVVQPLAKRRISEETCRKFRYETGDYRGSKVQIANYFTPDGTKIVAQKLRFPDKSFTILGKMKEAGLYGQHLWRDKGRKIVITEGEIDALTVSHLQDNKWPVVSIPNGAQGAKKALQKHLDWLLGFEEIVLFFDNDSEGHKAVAECAPLFPPGRCKVARMAEYKDASEAHMAGAGEKVISAIWDAKEYRPDGIVSAEDLWDAITDDSTVTQCIDTPWPGLNKKTMGIRRGEMVTFTAGSGIGKSALVREIAFDLMNKGEKVGMLMLEENTRRTMLGLMGLALNERIHLDLRKWSELPPEEQQRRKEAFDLFAGKLFLYDHFGSTDVDNLMSRLQYLAQACECGWIILDHISIVVSGIDDGDERKTIDMLMTRLRTFVEQTGVGLIIVSHLRRPQGDKGHEQGLETSLSQLRGSHSIAQLSDTVIGAERNQQDEKTKNITTLRVLKCRFTGDTGIACHILFDEKTGRMREIDLNSLGFDEDDDMWIEEDDEDEPF